MDTEILRLQRILPKIQGKKTTDLYLEKLVDAEYESYVFSRAKNSKVPESRIDTMQSELPNIQALLETYGDKFDEKQQEKSNKYQNSHRTVKNSRSLKSLNATTERVGSKKAFNSPKNTLLRPTTSNNHLILGNFIFKKKNRPLTRDQTTNVHTKPSLQQNRPFTQQKPYMTEPDEIQKVFSPRYIKPEQYYLKQGDFVENNHNYTIQSPSGISHTQTQTGFMLQGSKVRMGTAEEGYRSAHQPQSFPKRAMSNTAVKFYKGMTVASQTQQMSSPRQQQRNNTQAAIVNFDSNNLLDSNNKRIHQTKSHKILPSNMMKNTQVTKQQLLISTSRNKIPPKNDYYVSSRAITKQEFQEPIVQRSSKKINKNIIDADYFNSFSNGSDDESIHF